MGTSRVSAASGDHPSPADAAAASSLGPRPPAMFARHLRTAFHLQSERLRQFVYHHLLHADDPPHKLALGVAIGMFVTMTPTIGFQIVTVLFLAWLLRANKVVGLPLVWLSNPATFVPIFYPCYYVGLLMLRRPAVAAGWWKELAYPPEGWTTALLFYWTKLLEIALPLWTGCVVVGLLLGWITYYVVYHAIAAYRLRKWGRLTPPPRT